MVSPIVQANAAKNAAWSFSWKPDYLLLHTIYRLIMARERSSLTL